MGIPDIPKWRIMIQLFFNKIFSWALISLGFFLLLLNSFGWIVPMDMRGYFSEQVVGYEKALEDIDKAYFKYGKSENFLKTATTIIANSTVYQWEQEEVSSSGLSTRVPITENWLLWMSPWFDPVVRILGLTKVPKLFRKYQFMEYDPALRRGFGICSQLAVLSADMLTNRFGIETRVVGLGGHVVAEATISNKLFTIDSSFDVFMPFGIKYSENNLELVGSYYKQNAVYKTYNSTKNIWMKNPGGKGYAPKIYIMEELSYSLKWIFPIVFIILGSGVIWASKETFFRKYR